MYSSLVCVPYFMFYFCRLGIKKKPCKWIIFRHQLLSVSYMFWLIISCRLLLNRFYEAKKNEGKPEKVLIMLLVMVISDSTVESYCTKTEV